MCHGRAARRAALATIHLNSSRRTASRPSSLMPPVVAAPHGRLPPPPWRGQGSPPTSSRSARPLRLSPSAAHDIYHKRRNDVILVEGRQEAASRVIRILFRGHSRDLAVPGSTAMLAAPGWREPPTRTDPDAVTNRAHAPSRALKPGKRTRSPIGCSRTPPPLRLPSSKPPPQDWRRRMLDSPAVRSMLWTARAALTQQRHDYPDHSPSVLILVEICTRTEGAVKHCSIDHQMYEEYFARLALAIGDVLHSPEEGSLASVKCMVSIAPPPDRYAQQRGLKVEASRSTTPPILRSTSRGRARRRPAWCLRGLRGDRLCGRRCGDGAACRRHPLQARNAQVPVVLQGRACYRS